MPEANPKQTRAELTLTARKSETSGKHMLLTTANPWLPHHGQNLK